MTNKKHLFTFFCLYIAQAIPMSFFSTVLPVVMRQEHFSLSTIGLLQLIKLPWVLKFLWSPAIDRGSRGIGHYKRWIFASELLYALLILAVSFLHITVHFQLILLLLLLSFTASATQDIATDALAVLSFSRKDKSLANSMQSMGSFGGTLIGSGLLLLLFKQTGWNSLLLPCLALFVIIALLPLVFNRTLVINRPPEMGKITPATLADLLRFFTRRGIGKQIGFLLLYYSALVGTLAMLRPFLVDAGYDIQQIGVMSGFFGTAAGLLAAFLGGVIIRRIGRHRARVLFAVATLCTALYFLCLSANPQPGLYLLYIGVLLLWGSYGMATVLVYTVAMDCVRPGREGTDFTLQTVITHFSGICIALLSGKIADCTGYRGLFVFEVALACLSLYYVLVVFGKEKTND
jgi:MFS family permease